MSIIVILLLFACSLQVKGYDYEIIEELIPKTFIFDNVNIGSYFILKYNVFCAKNDNTTIYFQYIGINMMIYLKLLKMKKVNF